MKKNLKIIMDFVLHESEKIREPINDTLITEAYPFFCTLLLHAQYNAVVNFWVLNSTMFPSLIYGSVVT